MMQKEQQNIAIIYNTGQNYRRGIWKKLSKSISFQFDIYVDLNPKNGVKQIDRGECISSSNPEGLRLFPILKNIYLRNRLIYQKGIFKVLSSKNYTAVIVLGDVGNVSAWLILFYCNLNKIKVLQWTHGLYGNETVVLNLLRVFFAKKCDWTFTYGERAKNLLVKSGVKESLISVIGNSLDDKQMDSDYARLSSSAKTRIRQEYFKLIFVGRLTARKKVDLLINAVAKLNSVSENVYLTIVGDGPEKNTLESLVHYNNLQSVVKFVEASYDSQVNDLIFNSDLGVSPGHIGLFGIHSLSMGVPVVTHNDFSNHAPEFEAIIEGVTGSFYESGSINSLIEKIVLWRNIGKTEKVKYACRKVIKMQYNTENQLKVINEALDTLSV